MKVNFGSKDAKVQANGQTSERKVPMVCLRRCRVDSMHDQPSFASGCKIPGAYAKLNTQDFRNTLRASHRAQSLGRRREQSCEVVVREACLNSLSGCSLAR